MGNVYTVANWEHRDFPANLHGALEGHSLQIPAEAYTFQRSSNFKRLKGRLLGSQTEIVRLPSQGKLSNFQNNEGVLSQFSEISMPPWRHTEEPQAKRKRGRPKKNQPALKLADWQKK